MPSRPPVIRTARPPAGNPRTTSSTIAHGLVACGRCAKLELQPILAYARCDVIGQLVWIQVHRKALHHKRDASVLCGNSLSRVNCHFKQSPEVKSGRVTVSIGPEGPRFGTTSNFPS